MEAIIPTVVHEDPPHIIFSIGVFRCNPITQLFAICWPAFGIMPAADAGVLCLLNAPARLLLATRLTGLWPTGLFGIPLDGEILCLEFSPDFGRQHRKIDAVLALNNTHFAVLVPCLLGYRLFNFIKIELIFNLSDTITMSQVRNPVSLFSHLSAKLREFGELLPSAFQQRTGDGIKEPFPALILIQNLHDIVWHELLAPDYDANTKDQLKQIRTDLHRMVSATESTVAICLAPNLIAFQASIRGCDEYLYRAAHLLISFIRKNLDPLLDKMVTDAEKQHGKPMAISIEAYRPWDSYEEA